MPSLVQTVDYAAIAPVLVLALGALVVLVADLLVPARVSAASRGRLAGVVTVSSSLVALALVVPAASRLPGARATFCVPPDASGLPSCSFVLDSLAVPLWVLILAGTAVVALLSMGTVATEELPAAEHYFLLLSASAGALTLAASRDLLSLIVALEVLSLPAIALVALRRTAVAAEAALKFFLLSVVSTAVTLFGAALVYGATGAVHLDRIGIALSGPGGDLSVAAAGVLLTLTGFAFKVAAVPFHAWAPETYAGAPVPVAAYLSVVSKAGGFAGLLLLLTFGFAPYAEVWAPLLAGLAAVTMTVGNLVALRQTDAVRVLAWSSIAQSGFILAPLAAGAGNLLSARSATLAYLLAYAVMNLAAFTVVAVVGRYRPRLAVRDFRGLARTEPLTAAALAFALACLAGLPPGLLGLFAKVAVFGPPIEVGSIWLAVIMAVNVAIGLAYYLPWAASLWARPDVDAPPPSYRLSVPDGLALGATFAATVGLSVLPLGIFGSAGV